MTKARNEGRAETRPKARLSRKFNNGVVIVWTKPVANKLLQIMRRYHPLLRPPGRGNTTTKYRRLAPSRHRRPRRVHKLSQGEL